MLKLRWQALHHHLLYLFIAFLYHKSVKSCMCFLFGVRAGERWERGWSIGILHCIINIPACRRAGSYVLFQWGGIVYTPAVPACLPVLVGICMFLAPECTELASRPLDLGLFILTSFSKQLPSLIRLRKDMISKEHTGSVAEDCSSWGSVLWPEPSLCILT